MKNIIALVILGVFGFQVQAQQMDGQVEWVTLEQLDSIYKAQGSDTLDRKVFVDFYTDWCGWCKKMDQTTFKVRWISKYLNEKYYAVKFNAEQKEPVSLAGKEYTFVPNGRRGYNTFASEILGGKLSYPSFALLNNDLEKVQVIPGYQDANNFIRILTYFGGNYHTKMPWEMFNGVWDEFISVYAQ